MGTVLESIKEGSVEADLHNELMNPQEMQDELRKAEKVSNSTDPAKADFSTMNQSNVNLPSGPTMGDGNTGKKTSTLGLMDEFGLNKSANQPTQPSSDIGRITGYD